MIKLNFRISLLCICALLFFAGCAETIRVDSLNPELAITKNSNLKDNSKVAFEPFGINSKELKDNIIGEAKVGAFNSKATIISTEPVRNILENALKKGFNDAGFSVVDQKNADIVVSGTVEKFWVDEYATGLSFEYSKASVRYDLIIRNRQGATLWANTLDIYKSSEKSMDTTHNNIPTLLLALKESVEAIFKDQSFWKALSGKPITN